jgi:hypothetical protein
VAVQHLDQRGEQFDFLLAAGGEQVDELFTDAFVLGEEQVDDVGNGGISGR